jgi:hypothetical protein
MVASCLFFLLDLHYDARIHKHQVYELILVYYIFNFVYVRIICTDTSSLYLKSIRVYFIQINVEMIPIKLM